MKKLRTQVGIVGAGPAGLMLSHLLHLEGIDSIVIEDRSRLYVEERVRAGVLEQGTVDLMRKTGVADRLDREGMRHDGVYLSFNGVRHHISLAELVGRSITIYGQREVVRDLIDARLDAGGQILFEIEDLSLTGIDTPAPLIRFRYGGEDCEVACDFIGGCDGGHGLCRSHIPAGVLKTYEKVYPFAWLGVLAAAAPSSDELVYTNHDRGFALFSMRSPEVTRLYLQCAPDEKIENWSDDRIWSELLLRMTTRDGWKPNVGPLSSKAVTPMRSFVAEPMQYGRLYLAGDAAHIVPPTGAKGMNMAVADVAVLAPALAAWYRDSREDLLNMYSKTCLRRVWRTQRFSWWMTSMMHRLDTDDAFDRRRQIAELEYLVGSRAAMTSLAENYAG
jgi:p-hydroxybenzoate 3-monooxygenase